MSVKAGQIRKDPLMESSYGKGAYDYIVILSEIGKHVYHCMRFYYSGNNRHRTAAKEIWGKNDIQGYFNVIISDVNK